MKITSLMQSSFYQSIFSELPKEHEYIQYRPYDFAIFDLKLTREVWSKKNNFAQKVLCSIVSAIHEFVYHKCFKLIIYNYHSYQENLKICLKNKKIQELNEQIRSLRSSKFFLVKHYSMEITKLTGLMLASALVLYALGSAFLSAENYVSKIAVINMKVPTTIRLVSKRTGENIVIPLMHFAERIFLWIERDIVEPLTKAASNTIGKIGFVADKLNPNYSENPMSADSTQQTVNSETVKNVVLEEVPISQIQYSKDPFTCPRVNRIHTHSAVDFSLCRRRSSVIIEIDMPFSEIETSWDNI
ncbi:MAG: hypothetical protein WCT85_05610 [Parachlamydiales bacterium]|jgi:hypothetical protein